MGYILRISVIVSVAGVYNDEQNEDCRLSSKGWDLQEGRTAGWIEGSRAG